MAEDICAWKSSNRIDDSERRRAFGVNVYPAGIDGQRTQIPGNFWCERLPVDKVQITRASQTHNGSEVLLDLVLHGGDAVSGACARQHGREEGED